MEGDDGVGFNDFPLNSFYAYYGKPIAPDMDYGFGLVSNLILLVVLGIPILEKDVVNVGQPFYTNTVNNVLFLVTLRKLIWLESRWLWKNPYVDDSCQLLTSMERVTAINIFMIIVEDVKVRKY